ncbi:MAG: hypothetical protein ACE37F_36615 [Nannocystaceae bacterium]|nr:hypothetical protein [bacterium]
MSGQHRVIRILAAAAALSATGCKDDSGGGACKTIGTAGGIVSSSDGTLSLSFRPNSLSEDTEVCIARAERPGPPAVYGEAYRVTPDIDVDVNISVTYRAPLPDDTSLTRVGVILREDFLAGTGRWLSLPLTRLEPANELVAGTDTRISMFYGLLDDGGEGMIDVDSDGGTDSAATSSTDSASATDSDTTGSQGSDTDGSDTDGTTGGVSDTNASDTQPTDDETGDPSSSSSDSDSDSDSGNPNVDCDNLPAAPLPITQIATLQQGSPEDLAMTGQGTFVLADGDEFVEMDAEGNTTTWATGLPFDEDILGIRFDSNGTLYAAMGLNSTDLWSFTPAGGQIVMDTGLQLPNAIHIDSEDQIWVSDYFGDTISRIDPVAQTVEVVVANQANSANGVFLDEQRGILYWANYGAGQIWSAPVNEGVVGAPVGVADLEGNSDGITMDECGNLYVVDQGGIAGNNPCRIDLIPLNAAGAAAGDTIEIVTAGELGNACANAQFGVGFGDENDQALFVTGQTGAVYRVEVGLSGYVGY